MANIKNYKDIIFYTFVFIIILSGILVRLKIFELNVPFWFDEAFLGINFFDKSYVDFFNGISIYTKVPPLWGISVKLILQTFGYSIRTFRILSLVSSVISLFTFFILLKNIVKNRLAILTGLILFSFNYCIVYYSAEFRPYSFDVMISILLLLSYKYISFKNLSFPKAILYSIISIICILSSFASIFILPAIVFAKSMEEKYFNYKCLLIFFGIFITCIYLYLIDKNCYQFMMYYWHNVETGFWNFSVSSFNNLIYNFYNYIFTANKNTLTIYLNMFLSILGLILFIKNKQKISYLFILIFIFALSASFFEIFPFGHRHTIYLIPIIILLLIKNFDLPNLIKPEQKYKKMLLYCSTAIIFIIVLISTNIISRLRFNSNIEKYMFYPAPVQFKYMNPDYYNIIYNSASDNDLIILSTDLNYICNFYNSLYKRNIKYLNLPEGNSEKLLDIIRNQSKTKNLYIMGRFKSFENLPDINFIETELKKQNIKYKKEVNEEFYSFHTL